jgi:DNA gyrase subunit A
MGRGARGVRGIRLFSGQQVISLIIPQPDGFVLTASRHGYGKRTSVDDFPVKGRGAQGVIGMQISERNGEVVGAVQVFSGDELMLISDQGTLVRTGADEISVQGRNTQGVRLIALRDDEHLVGVERIQESMLVDDQAGSIEAVEDLGDVESGDAEPGDAEPGDAEPGGDGED